MSPINCPHTRPSPSLDMIIRTGGCERSEAEYPAPYKAAGSKLTAVIETIFVGEEGVSPVPARRLTSASPPRPHMRDHLPHAVRGFLEKDLHIAVTDDTQLSGGPKVLVIGTMGWLGSSGGGYLCATSLGTFEYADSLLCPSRGTSMQN